jgi:hypothetical protein
MYPINPAYFRSEAFLSPAPLESDLLDSMGRVRPLAPFQIIEGTPSVPALHHYGDERSGKFSDGVARLGTTLFGQKRLVECDAGIEVWDIFGKLAGVIGPTDFLARAAMDLSAGMAVSTPSGVLSEPTVTTAGVGNVAVGLAAWTVAMGDLVLVRCGILTIPDFTPVVGTPGLADPEYYLSTAGTWTSTSGTQHIASRVGPQTVRVRC